MVYTTMRPVIQQSRRQRWAALLAAALAASGARAGAVLEPPDPLRLHGMGQAATTSVLDRALIIDTNTSQRNLDLLLDARRAGDGIGPMRGAGQPGQPPAVPAVQPRGTLVPLGLPVQESMASPGVAERREWVGGTPGRSQAGLTGGGMGMGRAEPDAAEPRRAGQGAVGSDGPPMLRWMDGLRRFLRAHLVELLAVIALLAVGAVAIQAWARRR